MMFILQYIYMISMPIAMIFTIIAMFLPCWWSSETFQVGLWRARSIPSSSWILIEPDTNIQEGRVLFTLQILAFISILLTSLNTFIWFLTILRHTYRHSLFTHLAFLLFTLLTYFCISIMLFFIYQSATTTTTLTHKESIHFSYSFYLTFIILIFHTLSLISITMNLAQYRTNHHTIQPNENNAKLLLAFAEPIV